MRFFAWLWLLLPAFALLRGEESGILSGACVQLPWPGGKAVPCPPSGRLEHPAVPECSGIVASRKHPGAFWVHNDSGHPPQLFAIDASGKHLGGPIEVRGAQNRDWEDIAMDSSGRLIVADVGNNKSSRRDLRIYVVPEPELDASAVTVESSFRVYYADQAMFPSPAQNFDCESVFAAGEGLFFFTKHRRDSRTRLYGLDVTSTGVDRALFPLAEAEIHGRATAADISPDGRRVALLAMFELWVFELRGAPQELFGGAVRHGSISMGQAEAVAFDGPDHLLVVNEARKIYRVPVAGLDVVRP